MMKRSAIVEKKKQVYYKIEHLFNNSHHNIIIGIKTTNEEHKFWITRFSN